MESGNGVVPRYGIGHGLLTKRSEQMTRPRHFKCFCAGSPQSKPACLQSCPTQHLLSCPESLVLIHETQMSSQQWPQPFSLPPQLLVCSGPHLPSDGTSVEQRLFFSAETHVVDLGSAPSLSPVQNHSSPAVPGAWDSGS